jgi:hypothetical protein
VTCDRVALAEDLDDDDPHLAACPECRTRHDAYRRLARAIADGAPGRQLPRKWRKRTLARARATRSFRRRAVVLAGVAALAAAAAGLMLFLRRGQDPPGLEVRITSRTGDRRDTVSPGDDVRARGTAPDAPASELRIYRGSTLLLRCPGAPACERTDDGVVASWKIPQPGEYQIVWIVAARPLPPPTGSLAGDLRAATASGARLAATRSVQVL